jgi:hypothetical protein
MSSGQLAHDEKCWALHNGTGSQDSVVRAHDLRT